MDGTTSGLPAPASIADLAAQITELAGHLNAANRRWLGLIAEFDHRKGWSDWHTHSCAHWLNWQCGIDLGAAREKVRVAHALEQLPLIAAAMARGELSYSKVRALTRVASPPTEAAFLSIALHGTAHHVEAIVRQFRRATEAAELSREARQQAGRSVTFRWDDDGSLVIRARLPAETGTLLLRALELAEVDVPLPDDASWQGGSRVSAETSAATRESAGVSAETSATFREITPRVARRADAFAVLAESFLKHGAESLGGGERQQIVVHVDQAALRRCGPGRCEVEDGPSIPVETARRLGCDASLVAIVEDDRGEPLDVGRRSRTIPPALRRALEARDRGCRFPGCTHKRFVDGHHIRHWADGGETKLANLVSLCRFHHRQVHEGSMTVERLDDGAWRFVRPSGESLVSSAPGHTRPLDIPLPPADGGICCDGTELIAAHAALGLVIDARTAATRWRGERLDHVYAIDLLVQRAERVSTPAGGAR